MASPAQKIFEADSESLYDFVSKNGRGLYIPPYQRDYAWDKANVERLVDDTVQGLNALLKRPDESITFLGTIIAMNDAKKTTISPLIKNQVYGQVMTIIDGQQRLTTLLMLCLALLIEIETQWGLLKKANAAANDETKNWIETRVNDMRGLLSQMLTEEQRNGEGAFRHFPKMIRAFTDTWSYESDKATYNSPIAWLIFEYVKFQMNPAASWGKFLSECGKLVDRANNAAERRHLLKMMKVLHTKLRALPTDDEFPEMLDIVRDKRKQEVLFDEEFPTSMRSALESILSKQAHGMILSEAGELELEVGDAKAKASWEASTRLISLLVFARFALDRITLVVVTATTEDFAFDVFEALNTTGQPLTAIETFTPKVVQAVGLSQYQTSDEKRQIDIAFTYIKKATKAEERQKRSSELLVAFALAELGEKRSKNLADQRRFMRESFDGYKLREDRQRFIRHLADLSRFFDEVWVDDRAPKIGGTSLDALTSLCLRFLVDLGHTITAPLLAQYASAVTISKSDDERTAALSEFDRVTQAVTAFTVIWRGSRSTTDRIDQVYRDLMTKGSPSHGVGGLARGLRNGAPLPDSAMIQAMLSARLKADRIDGGINISGRDEWIEKVVTQPLYDVNVTLARFILLVAFDDTIETEAGELVAGKKGAHPTLTFDNWTGDRYKTVEHIAPQSARNGWSPDLYLDNDDAYERLGNLTLLPSSANQSLGDRPWKQKRELFGALAAKSPEEANVIIDRLKLQGVDLSEIADKIYCGHYLAHVCVLSKFDGEWNRAAVGARGRALAELAWRRVAPWLGIGA